ncbi:ImmA/IrrE family metallo-endopeptidase [Paenibacillus sp. MMS18-CY102]|nr:ImmA/IrrE family metallo-endopeptidase [Paenibacillus sp. MMS18-CY102]
MSIDLNNLRDISQKCSARELADIVLEIYFSSKEISFPIDIFKMLTDFGIYYQFLPFDGLEGVYSPEAGSLVATVGINSKRPYERQRFTAAHELCHHIKDYSVRVSPTDSKDPIERYADEFAGSLLAPERHILELSESFENSEGYLEDDDVLRISLVFGVSFMSLYWRFINLKKIKNLPSKKFFTKYQAFKKVESLGLNRLDRVFLRNIINSYSYVPLIDTNPDWYKLKNHLIYNDGRIEGLDLDLNTVSEICTDLRIHKRESKYFNEYKDNKNIIETVGHYFVCNQIFRAQIAPNRYELKELHRLLFKLSPNPDVAGEFRRIDNEITGAQIQTVYFGNIEQELYFLDKEIDALMQQIDQLSYSDVLERAVVIHHRLTQIHPFTDGNGRLSRSVMNWILKMKNLPPIYVEVSKKQDYLSLLQDSDNGDTSGLVNFFLEILLKNMVTSNANLSKIENDEAVG